MKMMPLEACSVLILAAMIGRLLQPRSRVATPAPMPIVSNSADGVGDVSLVDAETKVSQSVGCNSPQASELRLAHTAVAEAPRF
jgi:hypothetical protein